MQLRKHHIKIQRIKAVFISHLHGDHYFGLLGLLNSMQLLGRTSKLLIVCPSKLKEIFDLQMEAGGGRLQFPIHYEFTEAVHEKREEIQVFSDSNLTVSAFPLKHRIPCCGFNFIQQKKLRTFNKEATKQYDIPVHKIHEIKQGADFILNDGTIVLNSEITIDSPKPRIYSYCTDTIPLDETLKYIKQCHTLYHEATFMESEASRAKQTYHSTAKQAGQMANRAEVEKLLIGHFSARYLDLNELLAEAKTEFRDSFLAIEGKCFEI